MDIKKLLGRKESERLEFKESLRMKDEIGHTVSGFSNTKGGLILVGVSDRGSAIGVDVGKKTTSDFAEYIKRNTDPNNFPEIDVHNVDCKKIISVYVKESHDKPVFFKSHAYKRVGDTTQRIFSSEIRTLAKESAPKRYWDEQVCEGMTLEDIDEDKVRWFLKKAKYERNFGIEAETSINEALERLELMKDGKLTNAAVLLFGMKPQKSFLQAETRCARFKGTEPLEFIDMKVFGKSIIDQRDDAVEFVKEHIRLHAKIVGTDRVETWEYPIEAIREAITNAICHRDYEISSNVQIRIFDDRIEVWGCGPLPAPQTIDDLKKKHDSVLRNKSVGKCFFLIKFIEQWGTGTNRIIKECQDYNMPEPLFENISGSVVVTFRKYRISEEIMKGFSEQESIIANHIIEKGKISRRECVGLLDVSPVTAFRYLKSLERKKLLKMRGRGKNSYYVLA